MKKATMINALIETKDGVTSVIEITGDKYDMFLQLRESGIERRPSDIRISDEINIYDGDGAAPSALVSRVFWPEEFSILQDRYVNLDEMNYLGKRMDSFDTLEMDQFLIGITKLSDPSVKDLINLTFNLDHFTLVEDVGSYGKIGRAYVMNTEGCIPAHDEDDPKYAAIGK